MMTAGPTLLRDDDGGGDATAIVIMGASGNLTRTKLAPALFSLYRKGRLPEHLHIVGVARDVLGDQEFRDGLRDSTPDADGAEWDEFATRLTYATADVTSAEALKTLYERLDEFDPGENGRLNCPLLPGVSARPLRARGHRAVPGWDDRRAERVAAHCDRKAVRL